MTREEAINILNALKFILNNDQYTDEIEEALDMAIEALQQPNQFADGDKKDDHLREVTKKEDAISRQAVKDALVERTLLEWEQLKTCYPMLEVVDEVPPTQPEQRWIPCEERLPKDEKNNYWVCTDTGYQCECRWTNINHIWTDLTTNWHWHIMDIPQYSAVIAWMPLPAPYRKEGEADG